MTKNKFWLSVHLLATLLFLTTVMPVLAANTFPIQTSLWSAPTEKNTWDDITNIGFPDQGTVYWWTKFTIPADATLTFKGKFPHSRYMSFTTYNADTHTPIAGIYDVSIVPDKGSKNPFLPGALRLAIKRAYTITVVPGTAPANPAQNTFYTGAPGGTQISMIYRIYVNDLGRDLTGGVGLPDPILTLSDGTVLQGDAASSALAAIPMQFPNYPLPGPFYNAIRNIAPLKYGVDPVTFPAENPPVFRRGFNQPNFIGCSYGPLAAAIGGPAFTCTDNPALVGGQNSCLDIAYMTSLVSLGYGDILVFRGKMPTTPKTDLGNPFMQSGKQLRYWSITTNESMATTKSYDGVYDQQVPLDEDGYYTVVISRPEDRPWNAYWLTGVAWLSWPENGDGAGTPGYGPNHPDDALIIIRNMLIDSDFPNAIQKVTKPADLGTVLGPYLPTGQYMSKADFEALGFYPPCKLK